MGPENKIEVINRDGWRKEYPLQKTIVHIGSAPRNDIILESQQGLGVAPLHAQLIASVASAHGYRLVNLGDLDILLGTAGDQTLPPRASMDITNGTVFKLGEFTLVFYGSENFSNGSTGRGRPIELSMSLSRTQLAPHQSLAGVVMVRHSGDKAAAQIHLELEGLEPDCYEIEPGPLLPSGGEKEVAFRIYHRGDKPLAGDCYFIIRATAPQAYAVEETTLSKMIQVLPFYQHKLRFPLAPPAETETTAEPKQPLTAATRPLPPSEQVRPKADAKARSAAPSRGERQTPEAQPGEASLTPDWWASEAETAPRLRKEPARARMAEASPPATAKDETAAAVTTPPPRKEAPPARSGAVSLPSSAEDLATSKAQATLSSRRTPEQASPAPEADIVTSTREAAPGPEVEVKALAPTPEDVASEVEPVSPALNESEQTAGVEVVDLPSTTQARTLPASETDLSPAPQAQEVAISSPSQAEIAPLPAPEVRTGSQLATTQEPKSEVSRPPALKRWWGGLVERIFVYRRQQPASVEPEPPIQAEQPPVSPAKIEPGPLEEAEARPPVETEAQLPSDLAEAPAATEVELSRVEVEVAQPHPVEMDLSPAEQPASLLAEPELLPPAEMSVAPSEPEAEVVEEMEEFEVEEASADDAVAGATPSADDWWYETAPPEESELKPGSDTELPESTQDWWETSDKVSPVPAAATKQPLKLKVTDESPPEAEAGAATAAEDWWETPQKVTPLEAIRETQVLKLKAAEAPVAATEASPGVETDAPSSAEDWWQTSDQHSSPTSSEAKQDLKLKARAPAEAELEAEVKRDRLRED